MLKFKKLETMAKSRYALKAGVLLQAFSDASKTCTNKGLTDALAEWHLKNNPHCRQLFAVIPGDCPIPIPDFVKGKKGGPAMILPPEKPIETKESLEAKKETIKGQLRNLKIPFHPMLGIAKLEALLVEATKKPVDVNDDLAKPLKSKSKAIKTKA